MDPTFASPPASRLSSALYALLIAGMLVATAAVVWVAFVYVDAVLAGGADFHSHLAIGIGWLLLISSAATLLHGGAFLLFMRHAQGNEALGRRERTRWAVAHAFAAPASMPVYWWRYLR